MKAAEMDKKHVQTVVGPVAVADLGKTLTHEHVLVDLTCYSPTPTEATLQAFAEAPVTMEILGQLRRGLSVTNRDNCLLNDIDVAIEEISEFRNLGGGTIVDVTLPEIGRDPLALQLAARTTGLNIVMGCGHYVHLSHPASLDDEPVEAIADRLIGEIVEGVGTTGVRAGIIGELGTSNPLHPREEKVLRAGARAQQATGAPITIHLASPGRFGHDVLDILEEEGANPARVVMGHLDHCLAHLDISFEEAVEYQASLARRGCYVEYDVWGYEAYLPKTDYYPTGWWLPSDRERAKGIAKLFEAGFEKQILISQDICLKYHLLRYGGFGYGHILRNAVDSLADVGISRADIDLMMIDNPARMLAPSR